MKLQDIRKHLHTPEGSNRIRFSHAAETGIILSILIFCFIAFLFIYQKLFEPITLINDSYPVFQGVNGYGTIEPYHPEEKALSQLQLQREQFKKEGKDTQELNRLIQSIHCSFDQTNDLHNGDTVTYGCSYDQIAAMKTGWDLRHLKRTFTVRNLRDIENINPFDEITFSTTNNTIQSNISDKLQSIPMTFTYTIYDSLHVHVYINYDPDTAARHGYRFTTSEETIVLNQPLKDIDQSTLAQLSEESKEDVNKAAARLSFNTLLQKINFQQILPAGTTLIGKPALERWYLDESGKLAVVCTQDGYDQKTMHTWKITILYDTHTWIDGRSEWHVTINDAGTYTIKKTEEGNYYRSDPSEVK